MTALPEIADVTGSTTDNAAQKTNFSNWLNYCAGLLGTDGTTATALATLGALGGAISAKSGAYTVLAADRGKVFHCTGTWTLSLTAAATLGTGFSFAVINVSTGVITIDPNSSEQINSVATIEVAEGDSCIVTCNGSGFYTISGSSASAGFYSETLAKSGSYTLEVADIGKTVRCTGTWTLSLMAAATAGDGFMVGVVNDGAGTITIDPYSTEEIDGVAVGGVELPAGCSCLIQCNATSWRSTGRKAAAFGGILPVTSGGTGTTTAAGAADNLSVVKRDHGHNRVGSFCLILVSGYDPGSQAGLNPDAIVNGAYVRAATIIPSTGAIHSPNPTLTGTTWRLLGTIPYTGGTYSVGVTLAQRVS